MDDLIARLEAVTHGSFELDREIAVAAGVADALSGDGAVRRGDSVFVPKPYSVSLDAALTLVPEGWEWTLYSDGSGEIYRQPPPGQMPNNTIGFEAEGPALGMCAAALKARSLPWVTTSPSPSPS